MVRWYVARTDIEDLKNAEHDLRESEFSLAESTIKLEEAQAIAHLGYWEWDLAADRVTRSDETYRIYGLQPQEHPVGLVDVRERIHPEDREFVFRAADEALHGGARLDIEHRLVRPSGDVRFVHRQGDLKRDASGQPRLMFGTIQDITDRKHAEESLEKAFDEIKALKDQLYKENLVLKEEIDRSSMFEEIVGASQPLQAVLSRVSKVAPADSLPFSLGQKRRFWNLCRAQSPRTLMNLAIAWSENFILLRNAYADEKKKES